MAARTTGRSFRPVAPPSHPQRLPASLRGTTSRPGRRRPRVIGPRGGPRAEWRQPRGLTADVSEWILTHIRMASPDRRPAPPPASSPPPRTAARPSSAAAERLRRARASTATPTAAVAKEAGISQAYLFRLFPTKNELATALVERSPRAHPAARSPRPPPRRRRAGTRRPRARWARPTSSCSAGPRAPAAAAALARRRAVHPGASARRRATASAGSSSSSSARPAPPTEDVQRFFAKGMLLNVLLRSMRRRVDEPWAKLLMGDDC